MEVLLNLFENDPKRLITVCIDEVDYRIVGGYDVSKNKPWIAKLWLIRFEMLCGSTIINKRYVFTVSKSF